MTKITITERQAVQFNFMLHQLHKIHRGYKKPEQIRKDCKSEYGLGYEESLEIAYENLQNEALSGSRRVKPLKLNAQPKTPKP